MALTQFAFVQVGVGYGQSNIPVPVASTVTSEGIVPSGSNQQTTAVAPTGLAEVMCRVATDTAVYVAFGADPDATTAGERFFIPANGVEYFRVNPGDEAAVVEA
jgi:hypothetical protein